MALTRAQRKLILVGTVPTAYALNHAITRKDSDDFIAVSQQTARRADEVRNS